MSGESRLWCPHCSAPIADTVTSCSDCGNSFTIRYGIHSFVPDDTASSGNEALAEFAESHSEQDLFQHLTERENGDRLAAEIFDGLRDDWRFLVPDHIRGRCLDLGSGYGTRALMLADLADSVDAVDESLDKLRVLAASDHNLRSKVRPVHATLECLPFTSGVFDTVVAAPEPDTDSANFVSKVRRVLDDDGALVLKLAGPLEDGGLLENRDGDGRYRSLIGSLNNRRLGRYQRILNDEFESVRSYALFPTMTEGQFVFPNEDVTAASHIITDRIDRKFDDPMRTIATWLAPIAAKAGVLPRGHLVVCSDRNLNTSERLPDLPGSEQYDRFLIRGQRRTVIVYLDENELEFIRKVPKNSRSALYDDRGVTIVNEHSLLEQLKRADDSIVDTLPEGRLEQTPLGPVRTEQPVDGTPVGKCIRRTPEQFRRNLRSGFDWVARFQAAYGREQVVRSRGEVRAELSVPELELKPPEVSEPVTVFDTPTKSDHSPENLFVNTDTGEVTAAIDWEGGTTSGNPFRDPCKYAITLATRTFGGFEEGIERGFIADTPYAAILRSTVKKYTERLNLEPRGFVIYLTIPYVHKLSADYLDESKPTIWDPGIVDRIEYIWDRQDAITSRLIGND